MGNCAGIDWASEKHDVLIEDPAGEELLATTFAHDEDGVSALCGALACFDVEVVAIERPDGVLVDRLLESGVRVLALHPNQVKAARERFRASGGKSDQFDRFVLCELARTDSHRFRILEPDSDQTKALRALVRAREDLVGARVALANQLRAELGRFWPGPIGLFSAIDSPISLAFLARYPSPADTRGLGEKRLGAFLKAQQYSSPKTAAELLERLRSAPAGRTGEVETRARRTVVVLLVATLKVTHETAIDRALSYATRQVPMLRRRVSQDTVVHEKATGLVATSWRHTTARAVAEQAPDPQLHSHVLLHAAVRRDGQLVAIDSRSWLVHQREVGAAYRTELARELTEMGFAIRRGVGRGGRYFELESVPQGLLDRWSSRRHQVQAAIRERLSDQRDALTAIISEGGPAASEAEEQLELLDWNGQLSPKQERLMATATRGAKGPVTVDDLDTAWRRTAHGLGLSRERIEVLRHHPHPPAQLAGPGDVLEALTEFDATFPARVARAVALERSAGAPIQAALDQLRLLRASEDILVLADGTGTTREHRGRERTVITIAERLTALRIEPLPASVTSREADRLDRELARTGGRLSEEQRAAIYLACGEHPLVVIQGHAGTGKSTTLTGIARAHQTCGREIIVTSTAALAAERLANELTDRGVTCQAFSTAGLHAAITDGRVELMPATTVIHDEAALASTREQIRLLREVEASGARLIAVGDPRQNQPVGAGGLWTRIEETTRDAGAHVELTRNQRARDPADRRDQARLREGQAELAIRGYAARDRVHIHPDQHDAEDEALDAAHADRTSGRTTIVIAQTSNDHLDELNARAQAIRRQHGQLDEEAVPLPGRPYHLHPGDHVQIRHTINHEYGQLRNGTTGEIANVDPGSGTLDIRLPDATQLRLQQDEIARADLRLAYVQHPFPAQGHTTDTAHLIIAANTTREGSYVALTRAQDETHIYAAAALDRPAELDRLQELADRISRTEPEVPSIRTPLAHEDAVLATLQTTSPTPGLDRAPTEIIPTSMADIALATRDLARVADVSDGAHFDRQAHNNRDAGRDDQLARVWPLSRARDSVVPQRALEEMTPDETLGFER